MVKTREVNPLIETEPVSDKKTTGLSFEVAFHYLKLGHKIKRKGWGGYWFIPAFVAWGESEDKGEGLDGSYFMKRMIVACLKDNGGFVPAAPYQDDLLAEDWEILPF